MYKAVEARKPDEQLIIFAEATVKQGWGPQEIQWSDYLAMFKYYIKNNKPQDETYNRLLFIMIKLFGKDTVSKLVSGG